MDRAQRLLRLRSTPPVFVIGCQRSGTSLTYRLLSRFLNMQVGRDNGHFVRFARLVPKYGDLTIERNLRHLVRDAFDLPDFQHRFKGLEIDHDEVIATLATPTYAEVVRTFYALWALKHDGARWGGKTPDYSLHGEEVLNLFPDARFIHVVRDGRDVALSFRSLPWGPKDAFVAAGYWRHRVTCARAFGERLPPDRFLELRYEELLANPVETFRRVVQFAAADATEAEAVGQRVEEEIGAVVRSSNCFKWRSAMSPAELRRFDWVAGRLLSELEYEVVYPEMLTRSSPGPATRARFHVANAVRKGLRGEGFRGLTLRAAGVFRQARLRLRRS